MFAKFPITCFFVVYPNGPKLCGSFGGKMLCKCPSSKPLRLYTQNINSCTGTGFIEKIGDAKAGLWYFSNLDEKSDSLLQVEG